MPTFESAAQRDAYLRALKRHPGVVPSSAESCACRLVGVIVDTARHTAWHAEIQPLTSADATTLERAYGRPSSPARTYVDDQFERSRA